MNINEINDLALSPHGVLSQAIRSSEGILSDNNREAQIMSNNYRINCDNNREMLILSDNSRGQHILSDNLRNNFAFNDKLILTEEELKIV